jgi:hypothetical protein
MQRLVWAMLLTIVGSAAAKPGVAALVVEDTSILTRQASTRFSKLEALREATKGCKALGGEMQVISTTKQVISATKSPPPHLLERHSRAEVQIECVPKK